MRESLIRVGLEDNFLRQGELEMVSKEGFYYKEVRDLAIIGRTGLRRSLLFKVGEIIAYLYTDENGLKGREKLVIGERVVEMLEQCS